ncbi:MAG: (d)CMP kinase [Candidatus Cryptobacteroides sp.]
MRVPKIIIAVDGYSSTGKSSFAKLIAKEFSFLYLDSGAMYRAVTLFAMENNFIDEDSNIDIQGLAEALKTLDVHFENNCDGCMTYIGSRCVEKDIRSLAVSGKVSPISAVPEVRAFVDERLRMFGKEKGVVMDGRDIGTTVFPDAEVKIFMTADTDVRARRRADELRAKGDKVSLEDVVRNLQERDYIDSHRETSPLRQAEDAVVLDNSNMTFDQQMDWLKKLIAEKFNLSF